MTNKQQDTLINKLNENDLMSLSRAILLILNYLVYFTSLLSHGVVHFRDTYCIKLLAIITRIKFNYFINII